MIEAHPDITVILWMKTSISGVRSKSCTDRKPASSSEALAPGPRASALAEGVAAESAGLGGVELIHDRTGDRLDAAALDCTTGGGACDLASATGTACHAKGARATSVGAKEIAGPTQGAPG